MERERFCHPGGDGDDMGVGLCHVMLESAKEANYLFASTFVDWMVVLHV